MPRFLIEVPHGETTAACNEAIGIFLRTGSHFLTHADWGCRDGVHKAWILVEVGSRDEARGIVPALYRSQATIVQLNSFSMADLEGVRSHHRS